MLPFTSSQGSGFLVKRVSMLPVALKYANGSKAAPSPCGKILPEPANRPIFCGVASCFYNLSPRTISSRSFSLRFSSLPRPRTSSLAHNRPSLAHKHPPSPKIVPPRPAIPSVRRRFPLSFPYQPLTNPLAFSVLLRESSGNVRGMMRQWPFKARRRPFGSRA